MMPPESRLKCTDTNQALSQGRRSFGYDCSAPFTAKMIESADYWTGQQAIHPWMNFGYPAPWSFPTQLHGWRQPSTPLLPLWPWLPRRGPQPLLFLPWILTSHWGDHSLTNLPLPRIHNRYGICLVRPIYLWKFFSQPTTEKLLSSLIRRFRE